MSCKFFSSATAALLLTGTAACAQQQTQPGADFPEGPGKAMVVPMCGGCHDINRLKAGYTPEGWLWYNESFAKPNTIVRFDPNTEKFQTWSIPGGGDIVRNMDVTRDGNPVLANSLVNQVGLVEIGK